MAEKQGDTDTDTVKTRVLILSDTHAGAAHAFRPSSPPPSADLLIHCGDLTMTGGAAQYDEALEALARYDAPVKLVIAGNHDLTLDRAWMGAHPGDARIATASFDIGAEARWRAARDLWTAAEGRASREGVTFLDEGVHRVALRNGAHVTVYASPYTPAFLDWGFPYDRHQDRFNPPGYSFRDAENIAGAPVPSFSSSPVEDANIDILITHGPPWGRLDAVPRAGSGGGAVEVEHTGCSHLLRALMRARPLLHCFGHIHEGHGAERIEWSDAADAVAGAAATRVEWEREGEGDGGRAPWEDGILFGREGIARVSEPEGGSGDGGMGDADVIVADISADSDSPLVRGRDTLLVNAAIMTVEYRPENRPWLIELDLPAARVG